MSRSVLVTGGAGYIGAHTCKALFKAGYTPIVYDNLSTGHAYAVKWGPFVQGDLKDSKTLLEVFAKFKPQAVIHFAADAIVSESTKDPAKYYKNNVASAISLLSCMLEHGVKKIVFSSTCATYGNPLFIPIDEKHPQNPINPYGRTKLIVEQMLKDYEMAYGLNAVILRYFNAAGADLDMEIGENHEIETHLIPNAIQTALGVKDELIVYGTDFETPDGTAIRDYIHVQDLADAHLAALEGGPAVFNLGTGRGYSVFEVISAIEKYAGKKIPLRLQPRRIGDPAILKADASQAKEHLGWSPKVSDLETLIQSAWKWHHFFYTTKRSLNAHPLFSLSR